MKLLTKGILSKLPALGETEGIKDPPVVVKFFDPMGSWTWYVLEYDPKRRMFYGLVHGFEKELGGFSLDDLESIGKKHILGIERDLHWDSKTPLSKVTSGERR